MIKLGDRIDNRYRIESRIATGGMADVYAANDLVSKRVVCFKIMRSDLLDNPKNTERFKRETEAVASLSNPYVVKILGRGIYEGRPYMIEEYVKADTLRMCLSKRGYFSPFEACEIMLQITEGISFVHKHGVIHRDIKPDNIFLLPDGTIKITDFGISSIADEQSSNDDTVQGTVYYCSPEILLGNAATEQSDIYSAGVLFYELVTGSVPFDGATPEDVAVQHIKKHMKEASKTLPSIPKAIDKIIIEACRKRENERYNNIDEMHNDIVEAISNKDNFKIKRSFWSKLFNFK